MRKLLPNRDGQPARVRLLVVALAATGVALTLAGIVPLLGGSGDGTDAVGHRVVVFDAESLPSPAAVRAMHAVTDTGLRLQAPTVGLTVPLGALTMTGNNITPPGITAAYLIRNLGVPLEAASTGTVFVVMHSCRLGCHAPGDLISDINRGDSRLMIGDRIDVGPLIYTVTGSLTIPKTDIGAAAIWTSQPGHLVLITCLQLTSQTEPVDNLVVTAQLLTTRSGPSRE